MQTKAKIASKAKLSAKVNTKDDECVDGTGVDSWGDGCDWYDANPTGCGGYDTDTFVAEDECCVC